MGHGAPRWNPVSMWVCKCGSGWDLHWNRWSQGGSLPSPVGVALSNPLRVWKEQGQRKEKPVPFFPASVLDLEQLISSPPAFRLGFTICSLALRPLESEWIIPLAFLSLQIAKSRLWDFSPPWHHVSQALIICLFYILLVVFLWGTLINTLPSPFQTLLKRLLNKGRRKYQDRNYPVLDLNFAWIKIKSNWEESQSSDFSSEKITS